jgi:hypothetical protein
MLLLRSTVPLTRKPVRTLSGPLREKRHRGDPAADCRNEAEAAAWCGSDSANGPLSAAISPASGPTPDLEA